MAGKTISNTDPCASSNSYLGMIFYASITYARHEIRMFPDAYIITKIYIVDSVLLHFHLYSNYYLMHHVYYSNNILPSIFSLRTTLFISFITIIFLFIFLALKYGLITCPIIQTYFFTFEKFFVAHL